MGELLKMLGIGAALLAFCALWILVMAWGCKGGLCQ